MGHRCQGSARNPQDHGMGDRPGSPERRSNRGAAPGAPGPGARPPHQTKKAPTDLQRLEQTHAETLRFLDGSQRRLADVEHTWSVNRPAYERRLQTEGKEIVKAKRLFGVIDSHSEHFQKFWAAEDRSIHQRRKREQSRGHERGGPSRQWVFLGAADATLPGASSPRV